MFLKSNARFLEKYQGLPKTVTRISLELRPCVPNFSRTTKAFGAKVRETRATATSKRHKCARLEPQPLRKDRNAPDSNHSHFAKDSSHSLFAETEMRQTEPLPLRKGRNAPDSSHSHSAKTSDISSDDDSKAPMIQKKTIHMWGSPLFVLYILIIIAAAPAE